MPGADTLFAAKQGKLLNLRIANSYQSSSPRLQFGIAVQKGNSKLLTEINSSLSKLEAGGTVKMMFSKYGLDDWEPPK
jgi:ABC-type amino acid transport substrate-binding protein